MSVAVRSEDIAAGALGAMGPFKIKFSPDGSKVTYLFPDETGQRQIFSISTSGLPSSDGKVEGSRLFESTDGSAGNLSLEEQLRRERMRLFTTGISHYEWCNNLVDNAAVMLVPVGDKLHIFRDTTTREDAHRVVYSSELGSAIDPHLSPDGKAVAFVVSNDLYFKPCTSSAPPTRLTFAGADKGFSCAVADFVAQEEMSRYEGFWWSPDSRRILYTVNDESFIPSYQILHQGKPDPRHSEDHHYPFAGQQNPLVRLEVLSVPTDAEGADKTLERTVLTLIDDSDERFSSPTPAPGHTKEYYVARAGWWPDNSVMVQVSNREQTFLQLLRIDVQTGARTVMLEESTDVWINLHDLLRILPDDYVHPSQSAQAGDFYFLWGSERSGFMQMYLYRFNASTGKAELLRDGEPLGGTAQGWVVEDVNAVDASTGAVYLTGNHGVATERHLFRASLNDSSLTRLTVEAGWHDTVVDASKGLFTDVFSSKERPVRFTLHRLSEPGVVTVFDAWQDDRRVQRQLSLVQALRPPVLHTLRSGEPNPVDLHCALYLPPGVNLEDYLQSQSAGTRPSFPTIMSVYGGPHVMRVQNQWLLTADLRAQRLAQMGIVVIKCDNRGSYRRGLAFEGAIKHDMGNLEVQDQVTASQYFAKLGLVDAKRVGMFGWSYGGYMSAMALCRAADVFCCSVAGAPVTSWDGYDTHYTERYMGHPQLNVVGYEASSVMTHVSKMKGQLLLVHGLIDENVHFRHTARLINSLIAARKRYELILFPCERHSPHKMQDKIYLEDIMTEFFQRNLSVPAAGDATAASTTSSAAASSSAASVPLKANL